MVSDQARERVAQIVELRIPSVRNRKGVVAEWIDTLVEFAEFVESSTAQACYLAMDKAIDEEFATISDEDAEVRAIQHLLKLRTKIRALAGSPAPAMEPEIDESGNDFDGVDIDPAAMERREAEIRELREALQGIIDIGKRDMTNPKYDGYFETARTVLAELLKEAEQHDAEQAQADFDAMDAIYPSGGNTSDDQ